MDLTPQCALALSVNVARRFAAVLRIFLQRYLSFQVHFRVKSVSQCPRMLRSIKGVEALL